MDVQIRKYTTTSGFLLKKTHFVLEAGIAFNAAEKSDLILSGMQSKNILFISNQDCGNRDGATFEIAILMKDQVQSVAFPSEAVASQYETELNENLDALTRLLGKTGQIAEHCNSYQASLILTHMMAQIRLPTRRISPSTLLRRAIRVIVQETQRCSVDEFGPPKAGILRVFGSACPWACLWQDPGIAIGSWYRYQVANRAWPKPLETPVI